MTDLRAQLQATLGDAYTVSHMATSQKAITHSASRRAYS